MDLAPQVPPTNRLDGLDIDLIQCSPKEWLPPNLTFRQWDFFSEPPPDLVAAYDVVHIRLVALTIKNNDPSILIKNVTRLLSIYPYLTTICAIFFRTFWMKRSLTICSQDQEATFSGRSSIALPHTSRLFLQTSRQMR